MCSSTCPPFSSGQAWSQSGETVARDRHREKSQIRQTESYNRNTEKSDCEQKEKEQWHKMWGAGRSALAAQNVKHDVCTRQGGKGEGWGGGNRAPAQYKPTASSMSATILNYRFLLPKPNADLLITPLSLQWHRPPWRGIFTFLYPRVTFRDGCLEPRIHWINPSDVNILKDRDSLKLWAILLKWCLQLSWEKHQLFPFAQ